MRHLWLFLTFGLCLLCQLAGCATPNTPQGECEARAYDDPEVKALILRQTATTDDASNLLVLKKIAVRRATTQCLRDKGLAPPGGVEAVMPAM